MTTILNGYTPSQIYAMARQLEKPLPHDMFQLIDLCCEWELNNLEAPQIDVDFDAMIDIFVNFYTKHKDLFINKLRAVK